MAFPSSNAENGGQAPVEVLDASPTGAANKKRWGGAFFGDAMLWLCQNSY